MQHIKTFRYCAMHIVVKKIHKLRYLKAVHNALKSVYKIGGYSITNLHKQGLIRPYYLGKTDTKIRLFKRDDVIRIKNENS